MNKKIIILYDFKLYDSHWMIKELKKKDIQ